MRASRREGGFTLIEVLVVLAIMGMVAGLVATRGPVRSAGLDLRAAAGEVARTLRLARTQAIAANAAVPVLLDPAAGLYRVGDRPARHVPAGVVLSVVAVVGAGPPTITFAPDGSSSGGRVELASGVRRMQVGVEWLTGRVVVADAP